MTEKRTASEIRVYCERRKQLLSESGHSLEFYGGVHAGFSMQAATDLPRALEAAEYRGLALRRILANCDDLEIVKAWATNALAETVWLEEDTDGST